MARKNDLTGIFRTRGHERKSGTKNAGQVNELRKMTNVLEKQIGILRESVEALKQV
jgi:hypothetical protein